MQTNLQSRKRPQSSASISQEAAMSIRDAAQTMVDTEKAYRELAGMSGEIGRSSR